MEQQRFPKQEPSPTRANFWPWRVWRHAACPAGGAPAWARTLGRPRRPDGYPGAHRQCRPAARALTDTRNSSVPVVALGLLQSLSTHTRSRSCFSQVPGALGAPVPATLVAHGGRPAARPPLPRIPCAPPEKVAASAGSAVGLATLRAAERRGARRRRRGRRVRGGRGS